MIKQQGAEHRATPKPETPHKHWRVYREALEVLRGRNLAERCAAAGYAFHPERIEMPFLGRSFVFDVSRFELEPGPLKGTPAASPDTEHLAERILILHYVEKASASPLSGKMVGFDQLAGGRFYGSAFRKRVEQPLARMFSSRPAMLVEIAGMLGGARMDHGDASIALWPFPKVPMTLILWMGDDELPPNAKALFDDTAETHLSTEDLAVLGDLVISRMKEITEGMRGVPSRE